MNAIVEKSTLTGNPVLDSCAGSFSATKNCILLANQRRLKGCKVNPSCVSEAMPKLILLYALRVLSKKSDIDGEDKVCRSAEVCVKAVKSNEVRDRLDIWQVPEEPPLTQMFPLHILYHLSTHYRERILFQTAKNIVVSQ